MNHERKFLPRFYTRLDVSALPPNGHHLFPIPIPCVPITLPSAVANGTVCVHPLFYKNQTFHIKIISRVIVVVVMLDESITKRFARRQSFFKNPCITSNSIGLGILVSPG